MTAANYHKRRNYRGSNTYGPSGGVGPIRNINFRPEDRNSFNETNILRGRNSHPRNSINSSIDMAHAGSVIGRRGSLNASYDSTKSDRAGGYNYNYNGSQRE